MESRAGGGGKAGQMFAVTRKLRVQQPQVAAGPRPKAAGALPHRRAWGSESYRGKAMAEDVPHPYHDLAQEHVLAALLKEPEFAQALRDIRNRCPDLVGRPLPKGAWGLVRKLLAQGVDPDKVAEAISDPGSQPWSWQEVVEMATWRLLPRRLWPWLQALPPLGQLFRLLALYAQAVEAKRAVEDLCRRYSYALGADWGPECVWWTTVAGAPMPTPVPLTFPPAGRRGPRGEPESRVERALRLMRRLHRARLPRRLQEYADELLHPSGDVDRDATRHRRRGASWLRRLLGLRPRPGGRPPRYS